MVHAREKVNTSSMVIVYLQGIKPPARKDEGNERKEKKKKCIRTRTAKKFDRFGETLH